MKTSQKISIFIVDDHPLMRQALKASIQIENDMEVVGMATDGVEALELIPALMPNVVIMDLMMPNMSGQEAIRRLSKHYPEVHILTLSSLDSEKAIFKAVQAGTRGYLTKDVEHDEMMKAIRLVSEGKTYLPKEVTQKLMGGMRQNFVPKTEVDSASNTLTKREKEFLALLGKGHSNAKISENMMISESTVRVYLHQIMKKMGFDNRREAVVFAVKEEIY